MIIKHEALHFVSSVANYIAYHIPVNVQSAWYVLIVSIIFFYGIALKFYFVAVVRRAKQFSAALETAVYCLLVMPSYDPKYAPLFLMIILLCLAHYFSKKIAYFFLKLK